MTKNNKVINNLSSNVATFSFWAKGMGLLTLLSFGAAMILLYIASTIGPTGEGISSPSVQTGLTAIMILFFVPVLLILTTIFTLLHVFRRGRKNPGNNTNNNTLPTSSHALSSLYGVGLSLVLISLGLKAYVYFAYLPYDIAVYWLDPVISFSTVLFMSVVGIIGMIKEPSIKSKVLPIIFFAGSVLPVTLYIAQLFQ